MLELVTVMKSALTVGSPLTDMDSIVVRQKKGKIENLKKLHLHCGESELESSSTANKIKRRRKKKAIKNYNYLIDTSFIRFFQRFIDFYTLSSEFNDLTS